MDSLQLIEAVKASNYTAVTELIESGVDVNQQDEQGWTPLNFAVGKGDLAMVQLLIERGADVFKTGRDQRTPYKIALAAGRAEVAKLLRDAEQRSGDAASALHRPYVRAYLLSELRQFPGWDEGQGATGQSAGDVTQEGQPTPEDPVAFLHQDYTVTSSMWPGEDIIFSNVTPEWQEFCTKSLGFYVPDDLDYLPSSQSAGEEAADTVQ